MGKFQKCLHWQFYVIDNSSSERLVTTTLNKAQSIVRRTMNSPHNLDCKRMDRKHS